MIVFCLSPVDLKITLDLKHMVFDNILFFLFDFYPELDPVECRTSSLARLAGSTWSTIL